MPVEIERKFLVADDTWRTGVAGKLIRQGYLSTEPARVVRVRWQDAEAFLTIKGAAQGAVRPEYEYAIPPGDAAELLALCAGRLVEKTRFVVEFKGLSWEVDVFAGANRGLVVAECELAREDQDIERPPWLGAEVTTDHRYANSSLAEKPFTAW